MFTRACVLSVAYMTGLVLSTNAASITVFSTGNPDGKIATLSRIASAGKLETETADDFVLDAPTLITGATFTGLLVGGAKTTDIQSIEIELYRIFPLDSANPPSGRVITRVNSPSDNNFAAFDSSLGELSFSAIVLNASFTAANSIVNGINPIPHQFTGGEGAVTGIETLITVTFSTPFLLGPDHDFFRPEVGVGNTGNFLWLSAPKPIVAPGTPFANDLQTWIRNDGPGTLAPDWERIGTDVTQQGPFNATFTLNGTPVPEPSTFLLLGAGFLAIAIGVRRQMKTR